MNININMSKYIFLYNEPFEYIHFIDMLYREFHLCYKLKYDTYNIMNVSKSSFTRFSYAIELNLDDNVYNSLIRYYKTKSNADLIPFKSLHKSIGNKYNFDTDICFKQKTNNLRNIQKSQKQHFDVQNSVLQELNKRKPKNHISKDVFDELCGLLDYQKHN